MKTSSTTQTTWFVEPLNDLTNQTISNGLREMSCESEQASMTVFEKKDGEKRERKADVWEVPDFAFVTKLKSIKSASFKVFRKQGLNGKVEEAIFLKKKRPARRRQNQRK